MSTDKMKVEKDKALDLAVSQIEKEFGPGSIQSLGARQDNVKAEVIPTGSLSLDLVLGVGGIPRGRITEIFGAEASGKTTLALNIIAQAQKLGGKVLYVDAENSIDAKWAAVCGVDVYSMLKTREGTGEELLEITEKMMRSHSLDLVVIDSVPALLPQAELLGEIGDSNMALLPRLMSRALSRLNPEISRSNTAVIFINQLREKIGIVYGSPEVTPGGRALKFYSSIRIDLRKSEAIKNGSDIIGNRVRAKVVKNKVAEPHHVAEFDILFKSGISREGDIIDLGVSTGMIKKAGAFFDYSGTKIGQGREKAREYLVQHPEIADEIEKNIRQVALGTLVSGVANKDMPD